MASGTYNPGSGTVNAGNVISLDYTCSGNEYPNGAISLSSLNGGYLTFAAGGNTYTFTGYICDSSGGNAVQAFTLSIGAYGSKTSLSGSVSGATGLMGKALYLKFVGEYVSYLQLRGQMSASITTSTVAPSPSYVASTFSAADVNFGSASKVTISNASISDLKHKVTWTVGSKSYSTTTAVGAKSASYTIPSSWVSQAPSSTYATLKIQVETYDGSTKIGSTATKSYKANVPSSIVPTLTSVTATLYNASSVVPNKYIQGITGVILTFNGAAAGTGSTLSSSSYVLTCSKSETMKQDSSNLNKFTVTKLSNSGSITFTAKVKDARGRLSAAKTVTISVTAYSAPKISSVVAYRSTSAGIANENGRYITIRCNATYSSMTENTLTINSTYWQTISPSSTYVAKNGMASGTQYIVGNNTIDPSYSYQVKFVATDTIGKSATSIVDVNTAEYSIHVKNGGKGVAFGKTSEVENAVEINNNWKLYYKGSPIEDIMVETSDVVNNHTTTDAGKVLDARQAVTLWDAITDRPYGKRTTKEILANTNTCRIDIPGGLFLISLSLPGISRSWLGLVYATSAGTVSVEQINSSAGITVTGSTGYMTATFTYTSDTYLHMVAFPLRSNTFPEFY